MGSAACTATGRGEFGSWCWKELLCCILLFGVAAAYRKLLLFAGGKGPVGTGGGICNKQDGLLINKILQKQLFSIQRNGRQNNQT